MPKKNFAKEIKLDSNNNDAIAKLDEDFKNIEK